MYCRSGGHMQPAGDREAVVDLHALFIAEVDERGKHVLYTDVFRGIGVLIRKWG